MGTYDDFVAKLRGVDPFDVANATAGAAVNAVPGVAAGRAIGGAFNAIPDQRAPESVVTGPEAQVGGDPYARAKAVDLEAKKLEKRPKNELAIDLASGQPPSPMGPGGAGIGFGSLDKAVKEGQARIASDEKKLIQDERAVTDAEVEKTDVGAAALQAEADRQRAQIIEDQKIERAAQAKQAQWFDQSAKLNEDLRSEKLDSHRLFQDTGSRIGLAIGGALGGIVSFLKGGPNEFNQTVNRLIDQDIQTQEKNYDRQKDYLKQRDTLYGQLREQAGDTRIANLQYRGAHIEAAKMQLQSQLMRATNPVTIANGEKAADQLQKLSDQNQLALAQAAQQTARAQASAAAAAQKAAEKEAFDRAERMAKLGLEGRKLDIEEGKAAKEGEKNMVVTPGANGLPTTRQAISPEAAKSYQEYSKIAPEAKRLLDVMKRTENTVMGKAEYEAARAKLIEIMPTLYGYSRGPSVAQVGHTFGPESLPDWTTGLNPWTKRSSAKKLEDLENTINTIDSSMKTATFAPAQMPASVQFADKLRGGK